MQNTIPQTGYIQELKAIQVFKGIYKLWKESGINYLHLTYVTQWQISLGI